MGYGDVTPITSSEMCVAVLNFMIHGLIVFNSFTQSLITPVFQRAHEHDVCQSPPLSFPKSPFHETRIKQVNDGVEICNRTDVEMAYVPPTIMKRLATTSSMNDPNPSTPNPDSTVATGVQSSSRHRKRLRMEALEGISTTLDQLNTSQLLGSPNKKKIKAFLEEVMRQEMWTDAQS